MYRRWKESDGKDEEYKTIIIRQVKKSQEDAKKDNVTSKWLKLLRNGNQIIFALRNHYPILTLLTLFGPKADYQLWNYYVMNQSL